MKQPTRKSIENLSVVDVVPQGAQAVMIRLEKTDGIMPDCLPGQFVEVRIDDVSGVLLRRPISIHYVDETLQQMWLLVQQVGKGTRWMARLKKGDNVNLVMPLGNGFSDAETLRATARACCMKEPRPLLVGGGVGVAPLYYYGTWLSQRGIKPTFLLGARTRQMLLRHEAFERIGHVFVTTEDGSLGEKGFVTEHSILTQERFTSVHVCGSAPMMKAVARWAKNADTTCEVSLENMMACGLGACLCCVEKTVAGNVCVCKEGPVFDTKRLTWQI